MTEFVKKERRRENFGKSLVELEEVTAGGILVEGVHFLEVAEDLEAADMMMTGEVEDLVPTAAEDLVPTAAEDLVPTAAEVEDLVPTAAEAEGVTVMVVLIVTVVEAAMGEIRHSVVAEAEVVDTAIG